MQAAVLTSPQPVSQRPLRISEVAQPQLTHGNVLLRVRACGVCRTDLHIVEGELPPKHPQMIPGHQIVGDVVEGATKDLPRGSRVGVCWLGGTRWHGMEAMRVSVSNWSTTEADVDRSADAIVRAVRTTLASP